MPRRESKSSSRSKGRSKSKASAGGGLEFPYDAVPRELVVAPSVRKDPASGLPVVAPIPSRCNGYDDILGVLSGHKLVAIVDCSILAPRRLRAPEGVAAAAAGTPSCAGEPVADWQAWLDGLMASAAKHRLVSWKAGPSMPFCYLYKGENARAAAALSLLHHPLSRRVADNILAAYFPEGRGRASAFAIGTLLGFSAADIEASYAARALEAYMLTPDWNDGGPMAERAKALARSFGADVYQGAAAKWMQQLEALCNSDEVGNIAKNIQTFSRPLAAAQSGSKTTGTRRATKTI